jgi:hypothetical protein
MLLPKTVFKKDFSCFGISIAVYALFSTALITFFTPGVMVNDDIAMMAFSNGDFTGQPESQLVFIGSLIGELLQLLYGIYSTFPWYPFLFVVIQTLATATLATAFYKFANQRITTEFVATVSIIILLTPVLVLDISFSTTAMYGAVAGVISAGLILESRDNYGFKFISLVAMVLAAAGSLRFDFFLAATFLLVPFFVVRIGKTSIRGVILGVAIFTVPLGSHFLETSLSTSEEWSQYRSFNQIRGSMHGTPALSRFVDTAYTETTIKQIREFGWESEDLLLFGNWYFEDPKLFNYESLSALRNRLEITPTNLPIQASLENIFYGREWFVILCLLIVLLGTTSGTRQTKQLFLIQIVWFVIGALYISSRYRFPDRFALGAVAGFFICLIASSLILTHRSSVVRNPLTKRANAVSAVILGSGLFVSTLVFPHKFSAVEISNRNVEQAERLQSEILGINEVTTLGRVVFVGAQIATEGINPWTDRTLLAGNRFLGLGWATGSPHQESRKVQMELDGVFLKRLAEGVNNYILTNQSVADLLKYSYERRHDRSLDLIPVKNFTYGTMFRVAFDVRDEYLPTPSSSSD